MSFVHCCRLRSVIGMSLNTLTLPTVVCWREGVRGNVEHSGKASLKLLGVRRNEEHPGKVLLSVALAQHLRLKQYD